MLVTYFRSSSYNCHNTCQLQHFIIYGLGHKTDTGFAACLGTISHKVLEGLASCKKVLQDNPNKKKLSFMDREMGELIFTEKTLSSIEFREELTRKSYDYYAKHTTHLDFTNPKDYKFCQTVINTALTHNNGQFAPYNLNVVGTEPLYDILIDKDWAKFEYDGKPYQLAIKGSIDLVSEISKDTLLITDYKTGKYRTEFSTGKKKELDDFYNDFQLLLYHYAARRLYPNYKHIIMNIYYLQAGGPFTLPFDSMEEDKVLEMIRKKLQIILKETNPKPINQWRSDFKCKNLCHFYKNNWPGTETRMCNYVDDHIKTYGILSAEKNLKREGFVIGTYSEPGAV